MSPCLEYDCKSLLRLVLIQQGWRSHEQLEYRGCLWWAISQWNLDIMNLHITKSGVSMNIEVARRFEKSNRLHPKEAFTPLLLEGSEGLYSLKISKFWCPKMRSPVFRALNWVQKRVYFWSIWTSKCTVSFKYEALIVCLGPANWILTKVLTESFFILLLYFQLPIRNWLLWAKYLMRFVSRQCLLKPVRSPR